MKIKWDKSKPTGDKIRLIPYNSKYPIIYINKNHTFEGYGGSLGTIAFIALLTSMGFVVLVSKTNTIKHQIVEMIKTIFNHICIYLYKILFTNCRKNRRCFGK